MEVCAGQRRLRLAAGVQRSLLAILLINANQVVPSERLVELLWPGQAPDAGRHLLQVNVSQLRKLLEGDGPRSGEGRVLLTEVPGYELRIRDDRLDSKRFEQRLKEGEKLLRDGSPGVAADILGKALMLWRGDALVDLAGHAFALAETERLTELRRRALELRIESELALGRHAKVIPEIKVLLDQHPLRERLCAYLMLALYRAGRQAEASDVYQRTRRSLQEQLGMDPGPELQALLKRVLTQDPSLDLEKDPRSSERPAPGRPPIQLTNFVGRERDLLELQSVIRANRLVTLTGPIGCGKTRMAIELAGRVQSGFSDGVHFVELSSLAEPGLVAATVGSTLGLRERGGRPIREVLLDHLLNSHRLLILDNCEHLIQACAELTSALLAKAGRLHILVTSQQPLNIPGEVCWAVANLDLPQSMPADRSRLLSYEAIQLFVQRAEQVNRNCILDDEGLQAIAQICRRLDGIPLAIELAAAQLALLTPPELLARFDDDDRFGLLTSGGRATVAHHETLLAAVSWSYSLLDEGQRTLFHRLTVFRGGFNLDAAEQVCAGGGIERADVLGLLSGLVRKSFVKAITMRNARTRYVLSETLCDFGRRQLGETEMEAVRRQHALHYRGRVEDAERRHRSDDAGWLDALDQDHDNARAAFAWALTNDIGLAAELAIGWGWYRCARGYLTEARQGLGAILPHRSALSRTTHLDTLRLAALAALWQMDLEEADRLLGEAASLVRGEESETAGSVLLLQGIVALDRQDPLRAAASFRHALAIARACGSLNREAAALGNLGNCAFIGDPPDRAAARGMYSEAVAIFERIGDVQAAAVGYMNLSIVAAEEGGFRDAYALLGRALNIFKRFNNAPQLADVISRYSVLAGGQGHAEESLLLGGASVALWEATEVALGGWWKRKAELCWAGMRALLDPATADAAWQAGRRMTLEEAVTRANRGLAGPEETYRYDNGAARDEAARR